MGKRPIEAKVPPDFVAYPERSVESREVLADAHVHRRNRYLRHAIYIGAGGQELGVVCNRVQLDSLADRNAGDPYEPPTCVYCARRWELLKPSWRVGRPLGGAEQPDRPE